MGADRRRVEHEGHADARRRHDGDFSSRGPTAIDFAAKPDLVAPGIGTVSLAAPGSTLLHDEGRPRLLGGLLGSARSRICALSGTSMAAPVVSGTVALMLQANPNLTPNLIKAILQYTAQVVSRLQPAAQGAGFLNTLGAVRLAKFYATRARAIDAVQTTWSKHIIWGNHMLTRRHHQPEGNAWALGVVWGSAKTLADRRRQHRVGRQHRLGHGGRRQHRLGHRGRRQHRVGHRRRRRQHRLGHRRRGDNIVWGTDCGGADCDNIVWGTVRRRQHRVGHRDGGDNIVWGTIGGDNIVWGTADDDNIVWGERRDERRSFPTTRPADPLPNSATSIFWSTRRPVTLYSYAEANHGKDALPRRTRHASASPAV